MKAFVVFLPFLLFFAGCAASPEPVEVPAAETETTGSGPEEFFDPGSISQEVKNQTILEVQRFIEDLNAIIRAKDYEGWVSNLGEEYFRYVSSGDFLDQISEQPKLKSQNIQLTSPREYFDLVVVPSRAYDRVDDIEYVTQNRVKAFTVTQNGQRYRLYELEHINDTWKIIN
jgi:hypothetical protein